MGDLEEQELPLQLCIGAPKQKEELSDSRNRQAAGNDRRQNEDQIWQRRRQRAHIDIESTGDLTTNEI
jgi:hypothetical protein